MIKHLRFSQNCNLINIQCNLKWLVMEIHQSAIYTIQITRGIVIYLCFLRGSNLDILPKVGEWAGKVVKWWWFNLCSCHGPHYYIESKVLSGMIYHSIEYRVIPSAFNTQERIQNCKRLVMMHISWVNHKCMEEKIGWDRLWYPTTFLPIPTPITFYKHQILNLWTDWPPLWTHLVFVNNYWAWGDYMIICRS